MPTAIDNQQASLVLGQIVQLSGVYPSMSGETDPGAEGYLGTIRTVAFNLNSDVEADGRLLSIAQNSAVYSIAGTNYGGDGHTNFALPRLSGMVSVGESLESPVGMTAGDRNLELVTAQMPPSQQGAGGAVDNLQPSLTVQWLIRLQDGEDSAAGEMVQFLGGFAPGGYMEPKGQVLTISSAPELFARIGTTYGGDGITTFALPDLTGRTVIGADAQTAVGAEVGSDTFTITTGNLPESLGGTSAAIDNRAPAVAMNFYICTNGAFPSEDGLFGATLGEVRAFAGTAPDGWLLCNGAALPISQYEALYSLLVGRFPSDNQTFQLPDLRGRVVVGAGQEPGGELYEVGETFGSNSLILEASDLPLAAPVNTAPASALAEAGSGSLIFGDSVLSVADNDSAVLTVKLTVQHGTLTLDEAATAGLTITGDGTGSLTIAGQISAVNSGLTGLKYQASGGYRGSDTLTIETSDGALTDTDSVTISFPNVAPVVTANQSFSAAENQTAVGTVAATDVNGGSLTFALTTGQDAPADNALFTLGADGVLRFRSAPDFEGAHAVTYTVSVTATDAGGLTSGPQTVTVNVTNANDAPTGGVTVSGTPTQNQILTATNTLADQDGISGQVAYQWKADGQAISGATGASLTLGQAQVGKAITVTASYTDGGGHAESVTSTATGAVANVNDAPTGAVTISGAAQVGADLAAANTLADLDGLGPISYQWFAGGTAISGATAGTLTLGADLLGKTVTVRASYTDGFGHAETVSSAATGAVSQPSPQDPEPPPPEPTPPGPPVIVDGVPVQTGTVLNSDGSLSQLITIPVVPPSLPGGGANIPLATMPGGLPALLAEIPGGFGLLSSGMSAPGSLSEGTSALLRELTANLPIQSVGSFVSGAGAFLQAIAPTMPFLVQTVTPVLANGVMTTAPLILTGILDGGFATALVIDAGGLPPGTLLQLDNVDFAAVIGAAHITGGEGSQTVFGDDAAQYLVLGADDDELHGGGGNDVVGSKGGDDLLTGDAGNDTVTGGEGADRLFGGTEADWMHGNQGNDVLQGNQGADTLYGGQGDDAAFGGRDDDYIWGDLGADQLWGDLGDDVLNGNGGADKVRGGDGDDVLSGGQDSDQLFGDAGNDRLFGDLGDDTLTGGAGADVFVLTAGGGADVITDFSFAAGDRLMLDGALRGAQWSVAANAAGDAVISIAGGGSVMLTGVAAASVTAGWFV